MILSTAPWRQPSLGWSPPYRLPHSGHDLTGATATLLFPSPTSTPVTTNVPLWSGFADPLTFTLSPGRSRWPEAVSSNGFEFPTSLSPSAPAPAALARP